MATVVVNRCADVVHSEMVGRQCSETARVVVRVVHREMTVLCRQCLSLSVRVLLPDTLGACSVTAPPSAPHIRCDNVSMLVIVVHTFRL